MDFQNTDRKLSDFSDADLTDMLDNEMDIFDSTTPAVPLDQYSMDNDWLDRFFEDDPVLNDKMMSEALQPPQVRSDHSYSLNKGETGRESPLNLCKADLDNKELDLEFLTTAVPQMPTQTVPQVSQAALTAAPGQSLLIKREPAVMELSSATTTLATQVPVCSTPAQVVKQPTIILTTQTPIQHPVKQERLVLPKVNIKVEPDSSPEHSVTYDSMGLPPTPPSSNSSDSEGSLSPNRSAPSSPLRHSPYSRPQPSAAIRSLTPQPLFTSPIPQSGVLILTEEEKRTLIQEGYPIPNKLPLTKQEEKNLKKIRRKIKNKISAQESRRKKKEYLESLERRVESFNQENTDLRKKVDNLESNNRSLLSQLHKLQSLVGKMRPSSPSSTQTGTCLMVLVLCFAVFLGGWNPLSLSIGYSNQLPAPAKAQPIRGQPLPMGPEVKDATIDAYTTPNVRSRVLFSMEPGDEEQFGPHTPFSYLDMFMSVLRVGEPAASHGSLEMEPPVPHVNTAPPPSKVEHTVTVAPSVMNQAVMHPDIATNISTKLLAVEQRVNTTA